MSQYLTDENISNENLITEIISSSNLPFLQETPILLSGGSRSSAFLVGEYIVRLPRQVQYAQEQKREALISAVMQKHLPDEYHDQVTNVHLEQLGNSSFAWHKQIKGEMFDQDAGTDTHKDIFHNISERQQILLAQDVAHLLLQIHSIPKNDILKIDRCFPKVGRNENVLNRDDFNYQEIKSIISEYSNNKINLDNFKTDINTEDTVFCHNDLNGENLIVDSQQEHILQGIIDFGDSAINPRVNDFFHFYRTDRKLSRLIIDEYNKQSKNKVSLKEADYQFLTATGFMLLSRKKQNRLKPRAEREVKQALQYFFEDYNSCKQNNIILTKTLQAREK